MLQTSLTYRKLDIERTRSCKWTSRYSGCIRINVTLVSMSNMTKIIITAEDQAPKGGKMPEHTGCNCSKGRLAAAHAEAAPG